MDDKQKVAHGSVPLPSLTQGSIEAYNAELKNHNCYRSSYFLYYKNNTMKANWVVLIMAATLILGCNNPKPTDNEKNFSPLEKLKTGNERFLKGNGIHPDQTLEKIRELKSGQHPFAVIVSCSDSRVPPEIIFDQGLGDIFSIRTAGNVIGDYELGSIEYAVEHLGCKLVLILGHKNCGAIDAYLHAENEHHKNHIQNIIDYISEEEEEKLVHDSLKTNPDLAIRANIKHGVNFLSNSEPVLKKLVSQGKVVISGAYYDIDNGKITFD
jgi:carbonic anhydrase